MEAIRSRDEVAAILAERGDPISGARVFQIEQRVLRKLARDPELRFLAGMLGVLQSDSFTKRRRQGHAVRIEQLARSAAVANAPRVKAKTVSFSQWLRAEA